MQTCGDGSQWIAVNVIGRDVAVGAAVLVEDIDIFIGVHQYRGGIGTGAARALAAGGGAVVVELQRDADHLEALLDQQRRRHRAVDAARHGDDHAAVARRLGQAERVMRLSRSSCCASPAAGGR